MKFLQDRLFPLFLSAALLTPLACLAQQTNLLDTLKAKYDAAKQQIESDSLTPYSNALAVAGTQLKQKGDVDGYLVLQAEQKRFDIAKTLPEGKDREDLAAKVAGLDSMLKKIVTDRNSKMATLRKQYIAQLEIQAKQLLLADKIEEAKAVKDVLEAAKLELAVLESNVPPKQEKQEKKVPSTAAAFGGHHYLVLAVENTWHKSKISCENIGGHLVIITSKSEDDFVKKLVGARNAWIGCTDEAKEGDWRWVDGSRLTYKGWAQGEPNGGIVQNWGHIWVERSGLWADGQEFPAACVCEWDY